MKLVSSIIKVFMWGEEKERIKSDFSFGSEKIKNRKLKLPFTERELSAEMILDGKSKFCF